MKFCFWGKITDTLRGNTNGGGELQISLLAKALAMAGHQVVLIDPYQQESFITPEGVQVLHVPNWNKGWKGLRLFLYRIPSLYKMFVNQRADYYYVRMRVYLHFIPYLAAKKNKAKFLLAIASDIDVLSLRNKYKFAYKANFTLSKYLFQWLPNDLMFRYLAKRADYIVAQHSGQKIIWRGVTGQKVTFSNIIDHNNLPVVSQQKKDYFIYVGSLSLLKGADKLYELVKSLPSSIPVLIAGQPNDANSIAIFEKLKTIKNCSVLGRMSHMEALQLIVNAKGLINTSYFEGFPNVFLEAWAMGVPVLSLTVNPGNLFDRFKLGSCFYGELEKMKHGIINFQAKNSNPDDLAAYVLEFHDFNTAAERFTGLLNNSSELADTKADISLRGMGNNKAEHI